MAYNRSKNNMPYGWAGRILRVDLSNRSSETEDVAPYTGDFVGGRGINVKILYDEAGNVASPFDPANRLCLGPGVLSGTAVPGSSRTEITSVSPRGMLDSAGIGGFIGTEIKHAGYDNIVIQGQSDSPTYVYIHNNRVEFKDASRLWGKDPWETQKEIRKELGDEDIQSACIGCAGENRVSFACILTGRLSSAAGRCGLGAIMGAKNLKAVAVKGTNSIKIAKPAAFLDECWEMHKIARQSPFFDRKRSCFSDKTIFKRYIDTSGKFVAGNWEDSDWQKDGFRGLIEDPDEFWTKYAEHHQSKGSQQPGCFGCPVYHETFFKIPGNDDIAIAKCVDWLSLSGPVWLTSREQVIRAVYQCNKYGLDVVSTGNCISFLMELHHRGIISKEDTDGIAMRRGDLDAILSAIRKIANQEGFGKIFRNGVATAAKMIGSGAEKYAMHIKGLELYPEEDRAYKSMALLASVGKTEQYSVVDVEWAGAKEKMENLAVSLFGRRDAAFPTGYLDKALLAWDSENRHCVGDLLGVCKFIIPWGYTISMEMPARLFSLAAGKETSEEELFIAAQRTITLERAFNAIKGIRKRHDMPPMRLFDKPVTDGKFRGEVLDQASFNQMLSEYYELRGYDSEGVPTKKTFEKLGLLCEFESFQQRLSGHHAASSAE